MKFLWKKICCQICFSLLVFFYKQSRITGQQGKGEGISLTPHCHFHPLHRHLDISREITAESSPLHIASSRTRTGNLCFPSASPLQPRENRVNEQKYLFFFSGFLNFSIFVVSHFNQEPHTEELSRVSAWKFLSLVMSLFC